jgi:hypothetical protein
MPIGKPTNKILAAGSPIVDECVTEGTSVKPGLLVIKGTADHQVGLAGAAAVNVHGVADYDPRYPITDAFSDNHPVRILSGPIVAVLTLAESQTINKGDKLMAAANGQVQAYPATPSAGDEEKIIGVAEESVTTGAGETKPILAELK